MEEYPMENTDSIWQWCRARKKLFTMSKIHSMADGFSSVAKIGSLADGFSPNIIRKGKQCINDSPIRKSSTTFEGNALKSRAHLRNVCLPIQNLIAEAGPFKNGDSAKSPISVIQDHVSSSETHSDAKSVHPHCDSGPGGQLLPQTLGIGDESSVEDPAFYQTEQPSKSRVQRRVQEAALKQNRLFSDQGMDASSGQYSACHREISVDASSSCSISKVVVEDMELQSRSVNGQMRDLRVVGGCEASSDYIHSPWHMPASKKPKRDRGLVAETGKSPSEIENQKAKSEILCPGLHLLADVAIRSMQNDQCRFPENITQKEGIRKAIFIPMGVTFKQKRVVRRAKSTLKHHQRDAPQMLHDLQKNPSAANSKPLLTADNICKLGSPEYLKQSEYQMGVPFWQKRVVRRTKSTLKHHQRDASQMLHDLQKNLSAANSKPLLTADNICKLGSPEYLKQSENQIVGNGVDEDQMAIPQLRCSKRSRSQGLPSKYCDSVLQSWK